MNKEIIKRAKKVRLLLLDVDGVLTDGRIVYDSAGRDLKFFDVHDGMGVALLHKAGIPSVLVTAKASRAIKPRAKDMKVDRIFSGIRPKIKVLPELLKDYSLTSAEICFIGDDLVDLCLMRKAGFAVAVNNAVSEIKAAAHYVTARQGGRGAVRELVEIILKAQGKWEPLVRTYDV